MVCRSPVSSVIESFCCKALLCWDAALKGSQIWCYYFNYNISKSFLLSPKWFVIEFRFQRCELNQFLRSSRWSVCFLLQSGNSIQFCRIKCCSSSFHTVGRKSIQKLMLQSLHDIYKRVCFWVRDLLEGLPYRE